MSNRIRWSAFFFLTAFCLFFSDTLISSAAPAADSVTIYTPFTKVTVPPGESVDYMVDIINNTNVLQNLAVTVAGLPGGWQHVLKSSTYNVSQVAVLPGQKQSLTLNVSVPLKVNKGTYRFRIVAGDKYTLPVSITVSQQGTFETEFTTQQANMQGHSESNFTFNTVLKNKTLEKQQYALRSNAPRGWTVTFKPNYIQATSVDVDPNATKDIGIDVKPPQGVEAGNYVIPVSAETATTTASLNLEVVITGTFSMELTTPTGLLSSDITAGDQKKIEFLIRNTGSSILNGIELNASNPVNWEVTFDPKKVERLDPGKNIQVVATVTAFKKAIAGDYLINVESKTPETSAKAAYRISVKTPAIVGWLGILIIIGALGVVYYLFQKYGRR